jgi:hypothetical protein
LKRRGDSILPFLEMMMLAEVTNYVDNHTKIFVLASVLFFAVMIVLLVQVLASFSDGISKLVLFFGLVAAAISAAGLWWFF